MRVSESVNSVIGKARQSAINTNVFGFKNLEKPKQQVTNRGSTESDDSRIKRKTEKNAKRAGVRILQSTLILVTHQIYRNCLGNTCLAVNICVTFLMG